MKKMLKTMVSAICAVTMLASTNISVNAEYDAEEKHYYEIMPVCEYDENNENLIQLCVGGSPWSKKVTVDTSTEEFKRFLKNASPATNITYRNDDWRFIICMVAGFDADGNAVVVNEINEKMSIKEFDENNKPVFEVEMAGEPEISILYGVQYADGYWHEIKSGFCRLLVRYDENGEPEIVKAPEYDSEVGANLTKDLHTGEDIWVIFNSEGEKKNRCLLIGRGDINIDGAVNVKDVAKYARSIVQLDKIPDNNIYIDNVADLDGNGDVDLKDLTTLKSYLIGDRDSL